MNAVDARSGLDGQAPVQTGELAQPDHAAAGPSQDQVAAAPVGLVAGPDQSAPRSP
ncbi:hypothetical protein [Kitasatospora sp. NPDC088346]|uniref:hypothetical protein n=1 Tax=Kitasatospora sp. NPDC088346 TaxID=3364073 RepID=UPI00382A28A5